MVSASAWIDGEQATEIERADAARSDEWFASRTLPQTMPPARTPGTGTLHTSGRHQGDVFVWTFGHVTPDVAPQGDYRAQAHAALDALFDMDPRVAEGHFLSIKIIA